MTTKQLHKKYYRWEDRRSWLVDNERTFDMTDTDTREWYQAELAKAKTESRKYWKLIQQARG